MSNLTDRISYINGLAEGLKLSDETTEGKVLHKVLEMLGEVAAEMDELRRDHDELDDYVESIDNDLSDLEEAFFGDEDEGCDGCCDDEDEDEDEDDCKSCCGCHKSEGDEDEDDDRIVEYTCPHCGAEMTFEVDNFDFDEDYLCPTCHKPLFPETPSDEE